MNFIIIFCLLAPIKTLGASENEDNVEIDATVETSGPVIDNSNVIIDETINNEASNNQKQLSPVEKGNFYLSAHQLYNQSIVWFIPPYSNMLATEMPYYWLFIAYEVF